MSGTQTVVEPGAVVDPGPVVAIAPAAPAAPSVTIPAETFTALLDKAFGRLESDVKADGPKAFPALKAFVSKVSSKLEISWVDAFTLVIASAALALHFLPKVVGAIL